MVIRKANGHMVCLGSLCIICNTEDAVEDSVHSGVSSNPVLHFFILPILTGACELFVPGWITEPTDIYFIVDVVGNGGGRGVGVENNTGFIRRRHYPHPLCLCIDLAPDLP